MDRASAHEGRLEARRQDKCDTLDLGRGPCIHVSARLLERVDSQRTRPRGRHEGRSSCCGRCRQQHGKQQLVGLSPRRCVHRSRRGLSQRAAHQVQVRAARRRQRRASQEHDRHQQQLLQQRQKRQRQYQSQQEQKGRHCESHQFQSQNESHERRQPNHQPNRCHQCEYDECKREQYTTYR